MLRDSRKLEAIRSETRCHIKDKVDTEVDFGERNHILLLYSEV
jgi:hypothetical protein